MGRTWSAHDLPMFCVCSFHGRSMNNLSSYCGLVDAKIRASDKDLPETKVHILNFCFIKETYLAHSANFDEKFHKP